MTELQRKLTAEAIDSFKRLKISELETSNDLVSWCISIEPMVYDRVYWNKRTNEFTVKYDVNTEDDIITKEFTFSAKP